MATINKIPKCPPLRFPDFNDDWRVTTLGEVAEMNSGGTPSTSNPIYYGGEIPFLSISDISKCGKYIYKTENYITEEGLKNSSARLFPSETIMFAMYASVGKTAIAKVPISCSQAILGISSIDVNKIFLYYILIIKSKDYSRLSQTGTQMNLSKYLMEKLSISLPTLSEQKKIADFLSLIDERIQSCSETIAQMKSLRYGFYNTISHRRKQEWQSSFLRDILTERKENNAMLHEVYSVSVSRGIVNQIEHLGRSFASKDTSHYNTVHFGDIVYTKSPTGKFPYGIVKQSQVKSMVAVSPLYGVYIPDNYHIGAIINSFFESAIRTSNYLAPLIQKGAKNTMNITTQHFLDNKILLPTSLEEQKKIADFLSLVDERIEVEEQLLQQYEKQKRYLLKQMFV